MKLFTLLLSIVVVLASTALAFAIHGLQAPGDGPRCSSTVGRLPLDRERDAELVTSLQLAPPLVDPSTGRTFRVASFFSFPTIRDEPAHSFFHETRIFPDEARDAIHATVGFEIDGEASEYDVLYRPSGERTWGDVEGLEQVEIRASRIEAR